MSRGKWRSVDTKFRRLPLFVAQSVPGANGGAVAIGSVEAGAVFFFCRARFRDKNPPA